MNRFFAIASLLTCGALVIAASTGCRRASAPQPQVDIKLAMDLRAGGGEGAEAATAAAEPAGTGWGTLKGRFIYNGDPPKQSFLSVTKDNAVCGTQVPNQVLVVDSASRGVANIVIYARKVSRVFKPEEGAAPAAAHPAFDQKGCLFLSHVFALEVKDTLEIKNSDPVSHNTSLSPLKNPSTNPLLAPNSSATYKFTNPLSAPAEVTCSIHPWMKAYILARDDPYFAVSGPDGSFEIKNLPAGEEIEFQVWHEQATGGLDAKPGWSKGRFKIKVPADGVEDLQVVEVPATAFH